MPDNLLTLDRLQRLENWVIAVYKRQGEQMALGQDILDAVRAESTAVDSFIALVAGMRDANQIPADVAASILSEIAASRDKLNAAITANTPPAPPQP